MFPLVTLIQRWARHGAEATWTTSSTVVVWRKFTSCLKPNTVCCRKILETGMSVVAMDKWCRSLRSLPRVGNMVHRVWNAITVCLPWKSWARPHRVKVPVKRWQWWSNWPANCHPVSAMTGRACPTRNGCPVTRHLPCMRFHWSSSSCVWQHCTRAGQFRSPLCWSFHWGLSVRCWRQRSVVWPTTFTSRWACSQPLGCRRRTRYWSSNSPKTWWIKKVKAW